MIELLRKIFGKEKPVSGYTKSQLERLRDIHDDIAFFHIQEQVRYADDVCRNNIHNDIFMAHQFKDFDPEDVKFYNATSVGNLAYVALNTRNELIKEKCLTALKNYKIHVQKH